MKMDDEDTGSIPVLQTRKMPNCTFDDEKPTFHTNQNPPGPSDPFQLLGSIQVPYTINRYLRDYQRDGVQFIHDNYVKSRGCILGDDMGLGKTVQVISFLAAVLHKTGTWEDVVNNRPEFLQTQVSSKQSKVKKVFLIVSPLSVLYNWKDELDTWGHFKTVVVHGVRKEEELARVTRGRCEIALTTYETLRICLDLFNSIDWDAVIVDEVHKLKNNKSQITQAMKMLRCKVRVGLTGTILQNNLEELWCVMDWAIPGCLGTLGSFKNRFSDPIEQGQKHSATKRALAEGRKAVHSLAKRLSQRFLRRTKALISDQLPKKDDRVVYCSLTEFQQSVYQEVLYSEDVKLLLQSSEKCPCRSGRSKRKCCFKQNSESISVRNLYFSYLAILRKVANHVALLQSKEGTSVKQKKYVTTICEQVFKKFPEFSGRCEQAAFEALSDPIYSGKMKVLQRLINHFITRKDKVLLFSLSTKLLDILESHCMAEGLEYRRLDGTTKSKDRIHIVKEFNSTSDINLCLVSTMAGGLGLNFVGANVVVLFDPTWNPANDLQAIDRAYRIGQCRDVTVFRLISLGTVEEIIYLRQIYKQQLQSSVIGKENARRYFEAVQGTEGQAGELFGIRNLFRFQTDGTCLTRCILEREGRVEVGIKTARTLAMDDWVQELEPGLVSSHGSSGQAVKSATVSSPGVLDFSSASEDEDPCASRSKPRWPTKPDECRTSTSSAANVNLCALLQKNLTHWAVKASECSEESQSEENVMGSDQEEIKAAERKTKWKLYSDSEEDSEFQEQDDVHHNKARQSDIKVPNKKQRQNWARLVEQRCRRGKEIESFTSSEDEAPSNDVKSINRHASVTQQNTSALQSQIKKHHHAAPKRVQFTSLKSPAGHSREVQLNEGSSTGTIDTLLGGLQEVSYTHSNQKVVGSSKTENCISRAALRDVFELNKHSQLPANHLLDLSETQSSESDKDEGQQKFHLKHLATCSIRTSIHTNSAIISVGETPAAVRKQQLKEMAQFFRAKSVHEFAEELISSDSAQRLHRLREFYSHSCPDLTDVIQKTFPKPVPELNSAPSPSTASHSMTRPNSSSKRTHVSSIRKAHNSEAAGEKSVKKRRTKALSTTVLHPLSDGQSEPVQDKHQKTTNSSQAGETLKDREHSLTHPDSSAALARFHKDHTTGTDSIHPNKNLINDLIGDTSILDDLFKPKKSADRPKPTTPPVSTPAVRTTNRAKDFWDILNEGNEESINKLTDPSQVEKMCRTVTVPARSKREHLLESSQLWKKNEKFLWK